MINLRQIDLNLLLTLDVLLSEHNVTRAAQRLHLSQPSVSVHLAKLRDIFGDPLLLPGPRGMQPTARAEELREPLRMALQALEQALGPAGSFDPASASNTWRIAAADYGESAILLPALARLRAEAVLRGRRNTARSILHCRQAPMRRPACAAVPCSPNAMCWSGARGTPN